MGIDRSISVFRVFFYLLIRQDWMNECIRTRVIFWMHTTINHYYFTKSIVLKWLFNVLFYSLMAKPWLLSLGRPFMKNYLFFSKTLKMDLRNFCCLLFAQNVKDLELNVLLLCTYSMYFQFLFIDIWYWAKFLCT